MRLRLVPIDIKVLCGPGQPQLDAVELPAQHDLTAQPAVGLEEGRHVEQVLLRLRGLWQRVPVRVLRLHVAVARGAGQGRLARALHVYAVPVRQVERTLAGLGKDGVTDLEQGRELIC